MTRIVFDQHGHSFFLYNASGKVGVGRLLLIFGFNISSKQISNCLFFFLIKRVCNVVLKFDGCFLKNQICYNFGILSQIMARSMNFRDNVIEQCSNVRKIEIFLQSFRH